jgi:dTDP-4-dehydrorhamnose 3,5-epimerase
VFELTGNDAGRVSPTSTAEYFANATPPVAPRPANSVLDLSKIVDAGYRPSLMDARLEQYLRDAD